MFLSLYMVKCTLIFIWQIINKSRFRCLTYIGDGWEIKSIGLFVISNLQHSHDVVNIEISLL